MTTIGYSISFEVNAERRGMLREVRLGLSFTDEKMPPRARRRMLWTFWANNYSISAVTFTWSDIIEASFSLPRTLDLTHNKYYV